MFADGSIRYLFEGFAVDLDDQCLLRDNEIIHLTNKSFELLVYLIHNRGTIVSKDDIFKALWADSYVDETNLTQHIYRIRKALGTDADHTFIETVPKAGYRFSAKVEEQVSAAQPVEIHDTSEDIDAFSASLLLSDPGYSAREVLPNDLDNSFAHDKSINETAGGFRLYALFLGALITIGVVFSVIYFDGAGLFTTAEDDAISIAVLPFRLIDGTKDSRLELGMTDTVISRLSKLSGYRVLPTEAVVDFDAEIAQTRDVFGVGKQLHADVVVTGTIQQDGSTARVNLKFYDIKNSRPLCTTELDTEYEDAFALQDEVAKKAESKLRYEMGKHFDGKHNVILPSQK